MAQDEQSEHQPEQENNEEERPKDDVNEAHRDSERDALYKNLSIERKEGSVAQIEGEIPTDVVNRYRAQAVKKAGANLELPGFRKGHVPEHMIVERVGEPAILKEAAEMILQHAYPQLVINEELDVVGQPEVALTKLAEGNPIGFRINTAVMPEVRLSDYQKIAQDKRVENLDPSETEVTDEDVDNVIKEVRKSQAHQKYHQEHPDEQGHEHGEIPESQWPELTDEMVQGLGDFRDVQDFKTKMRENIKREKESRAKEKKRVELAEAIIAATEIDVPELFIESELQKLMAEFQQNLTRMGMSFEDYLARVQKTEDGLKQEWRPEAEKRAKLQLTLNEIAKQENIAPDPQKVERDVAHLKEMYPDADEGRVRTYVETMQTNTAVFEFLETGEKPTPQTDNAGQGKGENTQKADE